MKRAMAVCGSDYLSVRKSYNHRRFKFASRNFYPEFLAVIDILKDYRKYFPGVEAEPITPAMRYRLKASITLPSLAKQLNISLSQIKELNPVYTRRATKGWVKIPAGYWIHLPIKSDLSRLDRYFENRLQIADHSTGPKTISAGTLPDNRKSTAIAESGILYLRKPGVIDENSTWLSSPRNWGNEILSKHGNTSLSVEKLKRELQPKLAVQSGRIIVFTNETLGHYADWLKVSLRNLQNLNNYGRRRTIYQGQRFALNFSKVSVEEFNQKRLNYHIQLLMSFLNQKELVNLVEYEINQGESVWDLAKYQYRVPMEILPYFNIHADINKLYPGDILRIPIFQNNNNSLEETL
jgi:LysM repeat protein